MPRMLTPAEKIEAWDALCRLLARTHSIRLVDESWRGPAVTDGGGRVHDGATIGDAVLLAAERNGVRDEQ